MSAAVGRPARRSGAPSGSTGRMTQRSTVGWIELEGAHNVRDLGGLRAGSGRTRTGVLLRSDALDQLTAGDVRRLVEERGLAHVVDLRSANERVERGRGPLGATPLRYTEVEVIGPSDLA